MDAGVEGIRKPQHRIAAGWGSRRQIGIYLSSLSFLPLFSPTEPKHKKVEPKHKYNAPIPLSLIKLIIAQM